MNAFLKLCALAFAAALTLASCASAPSGPPPWAASPAAMREAFPGGEFIAQQGRGATRAAAEADATAAIARFLGSEVFSRVAVLEQYWAENGESRAITEIESEIFVQAQMQLFGVRHAQDAHFDREQGWVAVAYINRAEAWQVYGPGFRLQAEAFARLFDAAENESDPFRRALRFIAAQDYARSPDFQNAESLGQLIHPARMDAEFAGVRSMLASLPQRVGDSAGSAAVFLDIPEDFESRLRGAFSQRLAALGFSVTDDRAAAAAVCSVTVDEGRQVRDLGVFYFPRLQAVITSPAGALHTFTAEAGQQAAVTPDVARRRAYQALADRVLSDFSLEANF